MRKMLLVFALASIACTAAAAQSSRWLPGTDPIAKSIIQHERDWAESGCTHKPVGKDFLADDFQGTAPSGNRYGKPEAIQVDASAKERECKLDDAKVRLFGDNVAMAYGSERAIVTGKDGKENLRCLVWTDTWLKRNGKWEIIAVQDGVAPCK